MVWLLTVSGAATVRVITLDVVRDAESVICTVNTAVPLFDGVPAMTPPDNERPAGNEPEVINQV